eukprot:gene4183-14625_t
MSATCTTTQQTAFQNSLKTQLDFKDNNWNTNTTLLCDGAMWKKAYPIIKADPCAETCEDCMGFASIIQTACPAASGIKSKAVLCSALTTG